MDESRATSKDYLLLERLLETPMSRWGKSDFRNAARLAAMGTYQFGYLSRHDELLRQLRTGSKPGVKEKISRSQAKNALEDVERTRAQIAERRGAPASKVRDKDVAEWFSTEAEPFKHWPKFQQRRLAERMANRIKYLKRKTKLG